MSHCLQRDWPRVAREIIWRETHIISFKIWLKKMKFELVNEISRQRLHLTLTWRVHCRLYQTY
ncbi:mCG147115, partial [Mus musculus]